MALQEDFRISVRKGLSLLRAVRQIESKPKHELLSPTRLHNVTAIERMLVQLGTRLSLLMLFLRSKKVQNSVIESHCKEAALIFANSFPLLTLRMALVFTHSYLTLNSVNEWKLRVVALFAPCKEMFQSRGIQWCTTTSIWITCLSEFHENLVSSVMICTLKGLIKHLTGRGEAYPWINLLTSPTLILENGFKHQVTLSYKLYASKIQYYFILQRHWVGNHQVQTGLCIRSWCPTWISLHNLKWRCGLYS